MRLLGQVLKSDGQLEPVPSFGLARLLRELLAVRAARRRHLSDGHSVALERFARRLLSEFDCKHDRDDCEAPPRLISSPDMADTLEVAASIWPDARFVLVHRDCHDTIASLLDRYRFGYDDAPQAARFIARSPLNFVHGLALYWVEAVEAMLRFDALHREASRLIPYEALLTTPDDVVREVCGFLKAPWPDEPASSSACDVVNTWLARLPGSPTTGSASSLPTDCIGPVLRDRIDRINVTLGYTS